MTDHRSGTVQAIDLMGEAMLLIHGHPDLGPAHQLMDRATRILVAVVKAERAINPEHKNAQVTSLGNIA